jgi:hypothetical protein
MAGIIIFGMAVVYGNWGFYASASLDASFLGWHPVAKKGL